MSLEEIYAFVRTIVTLTLLIPIYIAVLSAFLNGVSTGLRKAK